MQALVQLTLPCLSLTTELRLSPGCGADRVCWLLRVGVEDVLQAHRMRLDVRHVRHGLQVERGIECTVPGGHPAHAHSRVESETEVETETEAETEAETIRQRQPKAGGDKQGHTEIDNQKG